MYASTFTYNNSMLYMGVLRIFDKEILPTPYK